MRYTMLGILFSAATLAAALAGCGGGVTCDPGACGGNGAGGSGGGGGGGTGGVGGGSLAVCGGLSGGVCPPEEFCYFGDKSCGADDNDGKCVTRPTVCALEATPQICGCDGYAYASECEAHAAGTDVSGFNFSCPGPPPQFACGDKLCSFAAEYCQLTTSDTPPITSTYTCMPLPAECGASPTCGCVAGVSCGNSCIQSADGSLTVTCFGG